MRSKHNTSVHRILQFSALGFKLLFRLQLQVEVGKGANLQGLVEDQEAVEGPEVPEALRCPVGVEGLGAVRPMRNLGDPVVQAVEGLHLRNPVKTVVVVHHQKRIQVVLAPSRRN